MHSHFSFSFVWTPAPLHLRGLHPTAAPAFFLFFLFFGISFALLSPRSHGLLRHQVQLLTSEYVPILSILMLFIHFQAAMTHVDVSLSSKVFMVMATLGRYIVAARAFVPKQVFFLTSVVGNVCNYVGFFLLIGSAASYAM
jgi:hypothetical protein